MKPLRPKLDFLTNECICCLVRKSRFSKAQDFMKPAHVGGRLQARMT